MDEYQRYAIYYLPEPGPLTDFGASWLGWDVLEGEARDHPAIDDPTLTIAEITETPRKYGFHGTIKPPFHISSGHSAIRLYDALEALCRDLSPVHMDELELATLGRFLALKPTSDQTDLAQIAARVVMELDAFRAPPSAAELERRRAKPLSAAQEANLAAWGYPYVLDEFRFHMTLSGSIEDDDLRSRVRSALTPMVAPVLPKPFVVSSLCLVGSDDSGRFHLIERFGLKGS